MGLRVKRKTFKAGGDSRAVVLPSGWIKYYGDKVSEVTIIGNDLLVIAPAGFEKRAEEIAAYMDSLSVMGSRPVAAGGIQR